MEKFSELPTDLVISILAKVSISYYRTLSLTSKNFESLLTSSELSAARCSKRSKETLLYVFINDPNPRWFCLSKKPAATTKSYGFWLTNLPIEDTLFKSRTMVGLDNCIYMIAAEGETGSKSMMILNCSLHKWSETKTTIHARNNKSVLLNSDGKIFVIGGTNDRFLHPEVYCPRKEVWESLPEPEIEKAATVVLLNSCEGGTIEMWYIFKDGANRLRYNSENSEWEKGNSSVGRERLGSLTVVIGELIFRITCCQMLWYDKKTMIWQTVGGFGEFEEMTFQAIAYGSNLIAFWNVLSDGRENLWCTEISFERDGDDVFGNQLWKDLVKSEEKAYSFLGSTTVCL